MNENETRDMFAAMALQGLLASPDTTGNPDRITEAAYIYADAMMKRRADTMK